VDKIPSRVKLPDLPSYRTVSDFGPITVAAKVVKLFENGALLSMARHQKNSQTVFVPGRRASMLEVGAIVEIHPSALSKGERGWRANPTGVDASNSWLHRETPEPTIFSSVEEALSAIEEAHKAYIYYLGQLQALEAERRSILSSTPHVVVGGKFFHMGECPLACNWANGVSHPELGKDPVITTSDGRKIKDPDARWEGMTLLAGGEKLGFSDVALIEGYVYDQDENPGLFYHDDRPTRGVWEKVVLYRNDTVKVDLHDLIFVQDGNKTGDDPVYT